MENLELLTKMAEQRVALLAIIKHLMSVDSETISMHDFQCVTMEYFAMLVSLDVMVKDPAELDVMKSIETFIQQEIAVEQVKQATATKETLN
jgi:hypothetical protein